MSSTQGPRQISSDRAIEAPETFSNLFGAFSRDAGWRDYIASAMALSPMGFACVLLIVVVDIAQFLL